MRQFNVTLPYATCPHLMWIDHHPEVSEQKGSDPEHGTDLIRALVERVLKMECNNDIKNYQNELI